MKIGNGLPLDTYPHADEIIRSRKRRHLNRCADVPERKRHAGPHLSAVSDYLHHDDRHDESSMAEHMSRRSNGTLTNQRGVLMCTWEFPSAGRELP